MTITEQNGDLFFWEIDLFDTGAFSSLSLVLGSAGTPTVFTLATSAEYIPGEIVYFGNFTRQYLDQQLQANGFDEGALYGGDNLWSLASFVNPPNSAISGQVTSNAIADFNTTAPAPGAAPEDDFVLTSNSVYVAQMQNTTVPLFETGMTETNGTGSVLIQDMQDGSYFWNLDITNFLKPGSFQLHYFANLSSQPTVLKLEPTPKFNSVDDAYEGNFTVDALRAGLTSIGAPPDIVEKPFNATPPVLFLKLDDTRNGSIVGFVFDANAEPTERKYTIKYQK
jgi:hypothetical protein